jgi:4-diphosphocytidyl-2-C-methyl-D-erythritol kinase
MKQAARVRAFAKINLGLRILYKRPDNYHELRSVFQTISLADEIAIRFAPARKTSITIGGNMQIADNLIERAARLCLDELRLAANLEFDLEKNIPMGAGLGGGSSDAAAVLLALPPLAGRVIPLERLLVLAAQLGSDVPFFLLGGTAIVLGRGDELYPLPDLKSRPGLVVAPAISVSTGEAYRALSGRLTLNALQNKLNSFQSDAWRGDSGVSGNDFEGVVFERHPELKSIQARLLRMGAKPASMTGSGSALFGLFHSSDAVNRAVKSFKGERVYPISLVSRPQFRSTWNRRLKLYIAGNLWPPQSPCAQ